MQFSRLINTIHCDLIAKIGIEMCSLAMIG